MKALSQPLCAQKARKLVFVAEAEESKSKRSSAAAIIVVVIIIMGHLHLVNLRDLDLHLNHTLLLGCGSSCASPPNKAHELLNCDHGFAFRHRSRVQVRSQNRPVCCHPCLPAAVESLSRAFGSTLFCDLSLHHPLRGSTVADVFARRKTKKSTSSLRVVVPIRAGVGVDFLSDSLVVGSRKALKSVTTFPDYQRLPDGYRSFSDRSQGAALRRASILWFRNDLRVHDNEALCAANDESLSVLPVYCFDPRDYGKSSSGFDKTGPYRAKFLLECVANLRANLRSRGSDLVVRLGKPEEVLLSLARSIGADAIYAHQEVSRDEIQSENNVAAILKDEGIHIKYFWGSTLCHLEDLPFELHQMPTTYSGFKDKVQDLNVRPAIEAPKRLKGLPLRGGVRPGDIPTLHQLGLNPSSATHQELPVLSTRSCGGRVGQTEGEWTLDLALRLSRGWLDKDRDVQTLGGPPLIGGESEGLQRLKSFACEHLNQSSVNIAEDFGDGLSGASFSCKISPWLAVGCLSPRCIFEDLQKTGGSFVSLSPRMVIDDKRLSWLAFELLWRDFFRFITKKYGSDQKVSDAAPVTACADAFAA